MRVTQEGMVANALLRLQQRLGSLDTAGQRLSSGKNVQVASDDVSGMNRVLGLRARIRAREQEARNAADGLTMLNIADSKLQTVNTRLTRVRELMVRAGGAVDGPTREAIAKEIDSIRDDLLDVANTNVDGRPLFAGTAKGPKAVDPTTYALIGDAAALENTIQRRISDQETVAVNVTAHQVFGYEDGENLFETLSTIATTIRNGDAAGVSSQLAAVDRAMDRSNEGLSAIGATTNRIDAAMVRNSDEQLALKGELAQVEDVDLAAAIMDLQTQEVAYQATLSALSRTLQPSLVEFLR